MNNRNKIILYLDNRLSPREKEKFEEDLKNFPELRDELAKHKKVLENLKNLNIHPVDEIYFANNIPRLRESLAGKRKTKIYRGIIYASPVVVIAFLFLFLFLYKGNEKIPDADEYTLTDEQINNLADNYSGMDIDNVAEVVGDSVWDQLISNEFSFSYETADSILQTLNGSVNYTEGLNEDEASIIYERLINKEFF